MEKVSREFSAEKKISTAERNFWKTADESQFLSATVLNGLPQKISPAERGCVFLFVYCSR